LAGGRTSPAYRRRGLFTAVVGARLREAAARGRTHVFVDALPTSEPILLRRGFEFVALTQPFVRPV
jgi:predicted GNAT family acetyltransferase